MEGEKPTQTKNTLWAQPRCRSRPDTDQPAAPTRLPGAAARSALRWEPGFARLPGGSGRKARACHVRPTPLNCVSGSLAEPSHGGHADTCFISECPHVATAFFFIPQR